MNQSADFISALTGNENTPVTFQTFDDSKAKRPELARVINGRLSDEMDRLKELNDRGAGIFITVNETDLKGRKAWNVKAPRALFVDDDDGTVDPSIVPVPPSIVVQSARGKHIYWRLVDGQPLSGFSSAQVRLASALKTDTIVKDVSRVLRVPGFYHRKGEPFLVSLLDAHGNKRYTIDQVVGDLPESVVAARHVECPVPVALAAHDDDERFNRCRAYLREIPGAIEGAGGDMATLRACMVGGDFAMPDESFWPLLLEWNETCSPPWEHKELSAKLRNANRYRKEPIGCRLDGSAAPDVDLSGILEEMRAKSDAVADMPADLASAAQACDGPTKPGIYFMLKKMGVLRGHVYHTRPISELMHVPGLVGDMAAWINKCSHKYQPMFALGGSIVAMSAILGRKVRTQSGARSNIYATAVGGTSCGKDSSQECIKELFKAVQNNTTHQSAKVMLGSKFASGASIETALVQHPCRLFLFDELGNQLEQMKKPNSPTYLLEIMSILKTLYSQSRSYYQRRVRAGDECTANGTPKPPKPDIEQPSMSIWGMTTPGSLYKGFTLANIEDGLVGRILAFETEDSNPYPTGVDDSNRTPPQSILDGFSYWFNASENPGADLAGTDVCPPDPLIVKKDEGAMNVFSGLQRTMWEKAEVDGGEAGPWGRVYEMALKLALNRACGINIGAQPVIDEECARWACELSYLLMSNIIDRVLDNVSGSKHQENCQLMYNIGKKPKYKHGFTPKNMSHDLRGLLTPRERADGYSDNLESGKFVIVTNKPRLYMAV